jgi:hypothetical protein
MLQQTTEKKLLALTTNYLMSANPQEEFDNKEFPHLPQTAESN